MSLKTVTGALQHPAHCRNLHPWEAGGYHEHHYSSVASEAVKDSHLLALSLTEAPDKQAVFLLSLCPGAWLPDCCRQCPGRSPCGWGGTGEGGTGTRLCKRSLTNSLRARGWTRTALVKLVKEQEASDTGHRWQSLQEASPRPPEPPGLWLVSALGRMCRPFLLCPALNAHVRQFLLSTRRCL